jgi:cell shape-determining protein MreC
MDSPPDTIESILQRIAVLKQTLSALQDENRRLREQLEQQTRTSARQTANVSTQVS